MLLNDLFYDAYRFLSTIPSVLPFKEAEQLQVMTQTLAL